MKPGSGASEGPYTFASGFESGPGTNPEELIGAAHTGCFSKFLPALLKLSGLQSAGGSGAQDARTPHEIGTRGLAIAAMKSALVYSTGQGTVCPACGKPTGQCVCREGTSVPRGDGTVRVSRETKGRKGHGATLISGVPLGAETLAALAKDLKQRCGSSGTVKDGMIGVQGDHRDRLIVELQSRGHRVKRAGG